MPAPLGGTGLWLHQLAAPVLVCCGALRQQQGGWTSWQACAIVSFGWPADSVSVCAATTACTTTDAAVARVCIPQLGHGGTVLDRWACLTCCCCCCRCVDATTDSRCCFVALLCMLLLLLRCFCGVLWVDWGRGEGGVAQQHCEGCAGQELVEQHIARARTCEGGGASQHQAARV